VIHEGGHVLFAICLNIPVLEVNLNFFENGYAYVLVAFPPAFPDSMRVLFCLSGSLFTLIIGVCFFFLFYYFKWHGILEMTFFAYFLFLIFDFFIYNLCDVFFLTEGDWYRIYNINPVINGIFLIAGIILLLAIILRFKHLAKRAGIIYTLIYEFDP
jgi:hypothetical protein